MGLGLLDKVARYSPDRPLRDAKTSTKRRYRTDGPEWSKALQQTVTPATPSAADPVQAAKALTDHIKASRETLERDRKIPDALLEQMVAANLFQLCMPRTVGGPQHHPLIAFEAVLWRGRTARSAGAPLSRAAWPWWSVPG